VGISGLVSVVSLLGQATMDIDANAIIWEFFSRNTPR